MKNILILGACICLMACGAPDQPKSDIVPMTTAATPDRGPFIHTVFFYLNDDVTEDQKKAFEKGMHKLGTCPTIAHYRIGKPAMTPRDIVDNDYGYAWIVEFENSKDQDAYQVEPIHLEFVELYKDLWKEVKVYDSMMMN